MKKIIAKKNKENNYFIPIEINKKMFNVKFDPGANDTVISIDYFADDLSDSDREKLNEYMSENYKFTSVFTAASGSEFLGYLTYADNVTIGNTDFPRFYYYIIIENDRVIALLGEDFLDNCQYSHSFHGDIEITDFDFDSYYKGKENVQRDDKYIHFIDEMIKKK